jgi:hypothetical protein
MRSKEREAIQADFRKRLSDFVERLKGHIATEDSQWTIKGFVDVFRNIYTISADTKIVSKILEIHLFPRILDFAAANNFNIVLAEHQNYYPDLSFVRADNPRIKFAVDLKTSYRLPDNPEFCNGFTLGSHGEYFINRNSTKNIQFPYSDYLGHFCLGIIYSRTALADIDGIKVHRIDELKSIVSVIKDFQFFVSEKWEIASDSSGSGNTANIGSITKINDILNCNGMFRKLGERWFDDYWMNYGKITMTVETGKQGKTRKTKTIRKLRDFLIYRGQNPAQVNPRAKQTGRSGQNKGTGKIKRTHLKGAK